MSEISYEEVTTDFGAKFILRVNADNSRSWIPVDESNSDYAAYCVWAVAEGLMEAPVVVEPEVTEPTKK